MNRKIALLSVYDKTGIVEFAQALIALGWSLISSGGTCAVLREAGVPVKDVAEITGQAPILDHRVATLHPEIHGGLLATEAMLEELKGLGYPWIDLVCVDFYPLKAAIAKPGATAADVLKVTDIGGPTLLRSGAKGRRLVICDPKDRKMLLMQLENGADNMELRNDLASKAEAVIADYCLASARFTSEADYDGIIGERVALCKYGENAWQTPAGLYEELGSADPLALSRFKLVDGMSPSYNNWCDIDRMLQTVTHIAAGFLANDLVRPWIAVGVKHGNACGAAALNHRSDALKGMVIGDPRAIFGGLVMTNFAFNERLSDILLTHGMETGRRRLLDGIVGTSFAPEVIEILRRKNDKCRLLENEALDLLSVKSLDATPRRRQVRGGFLLQPNYTYVPNLDKMDHHFVRPATHLNDATKADALLAWAVCATSNSNTITLVKDGMLIGNGVGQQDRVIAAQLAVKRARDAKHVITGAIAWSDSFFPFPDGVEVLAEAGVSHVFTTSGSVNDGNVINACLKAGVSISLLPDAEARGFYAH